MSPNAAKFRWTHIASDGSPPRHGIELSEMKRGAAMGSIQPDDMFDNEVTGESFKAMQIEDLDMVWSVSVGESDWSLPYHALALVPSLESGEIEPDTLVRHVLSGDEFAVSEVICSVLIAQNRMLTEILKETTEQLERLPNVEPSAPQEDLEIVDGDHGSPERWKSLMRQKDSLERDVAKWRKFYDDEVRRNNENEGMILRRVEEMKQAEQQQQARYNLLRDSKERLEEELEQVKSIQRKSTGDRPEAASIEEISRSNLELERQLDAMQTHIGDRNRLISSLYDERDAIEKEAHERALRLENSMKREREEANRLRIQMLELEHKHHDLLRSYREINERLIQLRNISASSQASRTPHLNASDPTPTAKTTSDGKPRLKMR